MISQTAARMDAIDAIGLLEDPTRKAVYAYVARQREPVSRGAVAGGIGIKRATAVFHLEKLVAAGLLAAVYTRSMPPASGRPSKLYRRSGSTVDVSLPSRRYSLIGEILLRALRSMNGKGACRLVQDAARDTGRMLGESARRSSRVEATQNVLRECLEANGFEPYVTSSGDMELGNCPFQSLAQEFTTQVCELNLALIEGMTESSGIKNYRPELRPYNNRCCVRLKTDPAARKSDNQISEPERAN